MMTGGRGKREGVSSVQILQTVPIHPTFSASKCKNKKKIKKVCLITVLSLVYR